MSYQKLFNNYFSTYGSQTGGGTIPAPAPVPAQAKPTLTQEQLNVFLKQQGMDNTPVVKPQTAIVPLTEAAVKAKMQEIGWRPTVVRKGDKKFDQLSRSKITAAGMNVAGQPSMMAMKSKAGTLDAIQQKEQQQYQKKYQKQQQQNQALIAAAGKSKKTGRTLESMMPGTKLAASTGKPQRTLKQLAAQQK